MRKIKSERTARQELISLARKKPMTKQKVYFIRFRKVPDANNIRMNNLNAVY